MQLLIVFFSSEAPLEQQLYGRTGRGMGILTQISMLIVMLATAVFIKKSDLKIILLTLTTSALISSAYSIFQSYGIDFIRWDTRTNGVIGTLGNPNFQSSFAALALVPAFFVFWNTRYRYFFGIGSFVVFFWTIYRTQSTQGYVASILAVCVLVVIFLWYKNRLMASLAIIFSITAGIVSVFGMLNFGPLRYYLYKTSVQSRGDFWRSAMVTANEHPITGVGIDSFGDYYLKYRDLVAVNHPFAEYADNAHNFFLEYAATGGYPLLVLHLILLIFVLLSFFSIQKKLGKFDLQLSLIFTVWVAFQAQSVISPGNIPLILWNAIISGAIIGYNSALKNSGDFNSITQGSQSFTRPFSVLLVVFGLIIYYPLFNTDRQQLIAMSRKDGDLAIISAQKFPESVLRYTIITRELLDSQLPQQALVLARSAVEFNPYSPNLWALILINPVAPTDERLLAKSKLLELDPLNREVIDYKVP
jgi:O-antigen ligase